MGVLVVQVDHPLVCGGAALTAQHEPALAVVLQRDADVRVHFAAPTLARQVKQAWPMHACGTPRPCLVATSTRRSLFFGMKWLRNGLLIWVTVSKGSEWY